MTRSAGQRMDDILEAIVHARAADKRMRTADSLGDDTGVQVAFQAIRFNLLMIREAVTALPAEVLGGDPATPWDEVAALYQASAQDSHRIDPAIIHRTVEDDLGPLEQAVRRLRAAQRNATE